MLISFCSLQGLFFMERPSIKISPSSKSKTPAIDRMVVVLPAPLCPIKPNISPPSTLRFN